MFFNKTEAATRFKDWTGFSIICPYLEDEKDLFIKGSKVNMISATPMMTIRRCENETGPLNKG